MKKWFFVLALLLATFFSSPHALAWDDCPLGEVNDTAPGDCARYVDTDSNDICDHSELAPEDRLTASSEVAATASQTVSGSATLNSDPESLPELAGKDLKIKTVAEVADFYGVGQDEFKRSLEEYLKVGVKPSDTFQLLHDNYGAEPSIVKELILSIKNDTPSILNSDSASNQSKSSKTEKDYFLGPISIILIIIYLASFALSKLKKISLQAHRKVWNIMLLATFLVSALLGLILTFRISYGVNISLPFNMLFWHVEAGIAMTLISIFHILWHLPYYRNILKMAKTRPQA